MLRGTVTCIIPWQALHLALQQDAQALHRDESNCGDRRPSRSRHGDDAHADATTTTHAAVAPATAATATTTAMTTTTSTATATTTIATTTMTTSHTGIGIWSGWLCSSISSWEDSPSLSTPTGLYDLLKTGMWKN